MTQELRPLNFNQLQINEPTIREIGDFNEVISNDIPIAAAPIFQSSIARDLPTAEQAIKPQYTVRPATLEDIDAIVEVDMATFDSVYKSYGQTPDQLREELREKFIVRLDKIGGEWMTVLETEGKVVGCLVSCPTAKRPEDFKSWEETTDGGTLETTYDPNGENMYVVTLSVLDEGKVGKDMLFAYQIGQLLKSAHYKRAFFESRLPGLREWVVTNKFEGNESKLDSLDDEVKDAYANEYFAQQEEVKGKMVKVDKLLRLYERIGCKAIGVVPDAYKDEPSLDYGVVFVYDGSSLFDGSDLPFKVPDNRATRWIFGSIIKSLAKSPKLSRKVFK